MSDRDLLFSVTKKDFEIQTFRAGGKGGQNQNKTDSGVRIIHTASGARAESRQYRDQMSNKKAAFQKLVKSMTFRKWVSNEVRKATDKLSAEEAVEAAMASENLLVEGRVDKAWTVIDAPGEQVFVVAGSDAGAKLAHWSQGWMPAGWKLSDDYKKVQAIAAALERSKGTCPCHHDGDFSPYDLLCRCREFREGKGCVCGLYVPAE